MGHTKTDKEAFLEALAKLEADLLKIQSRDEWSELTPVTAVDDAADCTMRALIASIPPRK